MGLVDVRAAERCEMAPHHAAPEVEKLAHASGGALCGVGVDVNAEELEQVDAQEKSLGGR